MFTDTSENIRFLLLVFLFFSLCSFWFHAVDQADLSAFERTLK